MDPRLQRLVTRSIERLRLAALLVVGLFGVFVAGSALVTVKGAFAEPPSYRCKPDTSGYAACAQRYRVRKAKRGALFAILPGVGLLIGLGLLFRFRSAEASPLGRALARPEEIDWIYPMAIVGRGVAALAPTQYAIEIITTQGKKLRFAVPRDQLEQTLKILQEMAPDAQVSWDELAGAGLLDG